MDTRVVYLEPGKINVAEEPLPELAPNQVLGQTHQAWVCGSERYFYRGISVRPEDEARGGDDDDAVAARAFGRVWRRLCARARTPAHKLRTDRPRRGGRQSVG